jgi:hypothetical protein
MDVYTATCVAYNSQISTAYGYRPSEAAGITFCVLFALSLIIHSAQATWKRQWWAYVFAVGALGELDPPQPLTDLTIYSGTDRMGWKTMVCILSI